MANSYVKYTASGATDTFALSFPYLDKSHISVKKNGVTAAFTWMSASTVKLSAMPSNGDIIEIRRTTPKTPLFNSADGSVLTDSALQTLSKQSIYLSEESVDLADDSADEAAASASAASSSASAASSSASSASSSASAASSSASAASSSASAAAAAEAAAEAAAAAIADDESTVEHLSAIPSLYMGLPSTYWTRTVNSSLVPNGAVVREVSMHLDQPYGQPAYFAGYGNLPYEPIDDGYRAIYSNVFALISKNPLRVTPTNTANRLDVGPQIMAQRLVPNTADDSYISWFNLQGSVSNLTATLGTDPFATASGTRSVQITMPNHRLSAGQFVYFPSQASGGGVTFGGPSDTNSADGNVYGSYKIDQVLDANRFTIKVATAASSSVNFGGTGKTILYPAVGTMPSNPFTLSSGQASVTVNHPNHNMVTGDYVFFEGGSTIGSTGIKIAGNHAITRIDANSYSITLNSVQDGAATSNANITGGGAPTYACGPASININAVNFGAQIKKGNRANPEAYFSMGLGSPPNLSDGNDQQWFWSKTGFFYRDRDEPADGGIDVVSLKSDWSSVGGSRYTSGPITATCSIAGTTATLSGVSQVNVGPGMLITGDGIAPNTRILMFLTGSSGGDGTYLVSVSQTVAATAAVITGFADSTVVGRFAVTSNPNAGAYYDTADFNVFNDTSVGAQMILRGNYGAGPITAAYLQYSNDVGDQEMVSALNNSLQTFGPGARGGYLAMNYGNWQFITNYQTASPRTWMHINGVVKGAAEGFFGFGGITDPQFEYTFGAQNNTTVTDLVVTRLDQAYGVKVTANGSTGHGAIRAFGSGAGNLNISAEGILSLDAPTRSGSALAASATGAEIVDAAHVGAAWTTFTPTLAPASGSFASASASGRYKLVGKLLHVQFEVSTPDITGASGQYYTLTLPASLLAQGGWCGNGTDNNTGACLSVSGRNNSNAVYVFKYSGSGSGLPVTSGTTQWLSCVLEVK